MRRPVFGAAMAVCLLVLGWPAFGTEDRFIHLEGAENTRDLGGLMTANGKMIRRGQLIRSGKIDDISQEAMEQLDSLGVTAVIDLRTTKEAIAHPAEWPEGVGPRRYSFPLMEKESSLIDEMHTRITSGTAEPEWTEEAFHDAFGYIPTDYSESIAEVFDVLINQPEGEAVLFHCSGGKDRTGIVTALVLTALGVPRDQIEADFMLSNVAYDPESTAARMAAEINAENGTQMPSEAVWPMLGVRPEYIAHFYDTIEDDYGSVENYLAKALELNDADIEALKVRYLQ